MIQIHASANLCVLKVCAYVPGRLYLSINSFIPLFKLINAVDNTIYQLQQKNRTETCYTSSYNYAADLFLLVIKE